MWRRADQEEGRGPHEAAAGRDAQREGAPTQDDTKPDRIENPHVLPCPLVVFHTTTDGETGRPLGELLRALGYV